MILISRRWGRVAAGFALSFSVLSSTAAASDEYANSDARMAARILAAQGSEAFEARDFVRALELFGRAGAIIPAPTITLMEARTLLEMGRLVEAADKYVTTRRMLSLDPANAVFRDAADSAGRELERLMPRIPTLRVRVSRIARSELPEIQIDGRKVSPALASVDRPTNPGSHRVEVRFSTGVVVREVTLAEGEHLDVEITPRAPAPASLPPPRAMAGSQLTARSNVESEPSSFNALGWAVTGVGTAFIGAGAVAGVLALNTKSKLDDVCNPLCPPEYAEDIDKWRRQRTLSYVGFGVGILGVAGGTYFLSRPAARSDEAPERSSVALGVGPSSLVFSGRFQ